MQWGHRGRGLRSCSLLCPHWPLSWPFGQVFAKRTGACGELPGWSVTLPLQADGWNGSSPRSGSRAHTLTKQTGFVATWHSDGLLLFPFLECLSTRSSPVLAEKCPCLSLLGNAGLPESPPTSATATHGLCSPEMCVLLSCVSLSYDSGRHGHSQWTAEETEAMKLGLAHSAAGIRWGQDVGLLEPEQPCFCHPGNPLDTVI